MNAIGITDSGGVTVLKKLMQELTASKQDEKFLFLFNENEHISRIIETYKKHNSFKFKFLSSKNFVYRFFFENVSLRKIIKRENINLIYNFSGSCQFFIKTPKIVKIQNLIFFSKELDYLYWKKLKFLPWIKKIFIKRLIFKIMYTQTKFFEVQSKHSIKNISKFIDLENKLFFVKSDIEVDEKKNMTPKNYDFFKKVKILFIVGPHFNSLHKNLEEFVKAMVKLKNSKINFEINISLTKKELNNTKYWDTSLNEITNFYGYQQGSEKLENLFSDNTILISTSVIESLGLHVIEALKNGVVSITPDEKYSIEVYGEQSLRYKLFNSDSLFNKILETTQGKIDIKKNMAEQLEGLIQRERKKYNNILDVFKKILSQS